MGDIIEHLPFLTRVCLDIGAEVILELGVMSGCSTKAFLLAAQPLNAKVISVDIEQSCGKISKSPYWEFHCIDDLKFEIKGPIDVLFIDTSHTYDHTLAELRRFAPKVIAGGVVILHDTISCPPVLRAIESYLHANPATYTFTNRTNNNGLGILWKK